MSSLRNWQWRRPAASPAHPDARERGLSAAGGGRPARSSAPVSRSGFWLIGGTLILAAVVLVWAFAEEIPGVTTAHTASPGERTSRGSAARPPTALPVEEPEAPIEVGGPPSVSSDYSALIKRDVFQPLVVPKRPAPTHVGGVARLAEPAAKNTDPDTWHGWRFNGLAQLSGITYALVEQPDNRRSSFVKEGDHLEDARVIVVGPDEIVLPEEAGGVAHVKRVDAMAELLRATHRTTAGARGPAAGAALPGAGTVPVLPGGNPLAAPGSPGGAPAALPSPAAVPDGFDSRREQRRRQRQGLPGEESGTNANPNSAP
jgi:hypothetical protein